ncbi:TetR/AcrR family transcriptional regulator [Gordonia sp. WA4-43]|uniref:TetR/AcrR family transcriptional regulator n=1 Tax=Gordonia sp. WA4-43 TaxID=2878678 RepID=UPI001CF9911F|nr:TetR/AcrR family transcriptional regulator [Gordonia sp. WA4-43]UCZ88297.1 TetR/AcrR family transcriptional regulator [Gordonia sp. WA4-43]
MTAVPDQTPSTGTPPGRRYGGADPTQRRERRRAALIAAGLDAFGTDGYANVSVRGICDLAGLTQRYFYESFTDRAALLVAVYDDCVNFVRAATVDAAAEIAGAAPGSSDSAEGVAAERVPEVTRAALGAFMSCLADDPRRARVMLVEVVGVSPEIEQVRMRAIHDWAALILALARGSRPTSDRERLASVGLVGAVTQLLVDWYVAGAGEADAERYALDEILDVCVELFVAAYGRLLT